MVLTLEQALTIASAALAEGGTRGLAPLCASDLDQDGHVPALLREERASIDLDGEDFRAARPLFLGVDAVGTRVRRRLQSMTSRPSHEGSRI